MTLGWGTLCFSGENGHLPFHTLTLLVTTVAANSATTSAFHQKWTNENPYSFTKWHAILPLHSLVSGRAFLWSRWFTLWPPERSSVSVCFIWGTRCCFVARTWFLFLLGHSFFLFSQQKSGGRIMYSTLVGGCQSLPHPEQSILSSPSGSLGGRAPVSILEEQQTVIINTFIHSLSLSHPHTCLGKESGVRSLTSWTVVTKSPHCFES